MNHCRNMSRLSAKNTLQCAEVGLEVGKEGSGCQVGKEMMSVRRTVARATVPILNNQKYDLRLHHYASRELSLSPSDDQPLLLVDAGPPHYHPPLCVHQGSEIGERNVFPLRALRESRSANFVRQEFILPITSLDCALLCVDNPAVT